MFLDKFNREFQGNITFLCGCAVQKATLRCLKIGTLEVCVYPVNSKGIDFMHAYIKVSVILNSGLPYRESASYTYTLNTCTSKLTMKNVATMDNIPIALLWYITNETTPQVVQNDAINTIT